MGHPKSPTIHLQHFDKGRSTPREFHAKHAYPKGAKCQACGTAVGLHTRYTSLAPLADLLRTDDGFAERYATHPAVIATALVQLRGPDGKPATYVRMGTVYACAPCSPAADRAAARSVPSWWVVDIDRGPGDQKVVCGPTTFTTDPLIVL